MTFPASIIQAEFSENLAPVATLSTAAFLCLFLQAGEAVHYEGCRVVTESGSDDEGRRQGLPSSSIDQLVYRYCWIGPLGVMITNDEAQVAAREVGLLLGVDLTLTTSPGLNTMVPA